MRPIFKPGVRVNVAWPSRVGVGTLGGLTKSGRLEAFLADFPRASLPLAPDGSGDVLSFFMVAVNFASASASGSADFLVAAAESEGPSLAFAFSVTAGGFAGLAARNSCGVVYKSITSR